LAAASAGVLYCDDVGVIKAAALAVDRMVFAKRPVERHAWTRRYAQIIANHVAANKVDIPDEMIRRSAPPYSSEPISDWPALEQLATSSESARSIFHSVVGFISTPFDGKAPIIAGDFGRYTMGGIDSSFSESIRGDRPPLPRKDEIKLIRERVVALGSGVRDSYAELSRLSELRRSSRFSDRIKFIDDLGDSSLKNDDNEQKESELEQFYDEAESLFLALLPDELKEDYQRLQPIDGFRDKGIPKFSLLRGQCWVFRRALDLGWQQSLHDEIEKSRLIYPYSRHDPKVERIGKKYQHIAFAELAGYLADYHWYVDWDKEPSVLMHLEDFERADIDATYLSGSYSKPAKTFMPSSIRVRKWPLFRTVRKATWPGRRRWMIFQTLNNFLFNWTRRGTHGVCFTAFVEVRIT
jgi:hypothetical protein